MKRIVIIIAVSILALASAIDSKATERVWVSTDKDVYIAGDMVWCSVFVVDATTGKLSSGNSTAYVELSSVSGMAASAKIALVGGRGSGSFQIPLSTQTGNYSLLGYTASTQGRGDLTSDARILSVFNTSSSVRVKGGVDIVDASSYPEVKTPVGQNAGSIDLVTSASARSSFATVSIGNAMPASTTLSLSVYREDGIVSPSGKTLADFMASSCEPFEGRNQDKEGETFRGRLFGADAETVIADNDLLAIVAFPGNAEDVYAGKIAADGTVDFSTGNVYGSRDMVCEIVGLDDSRDCRLMIESPFIGVKVADIPSLKLSESVKDALELRISALDTKVAPDTLVEYLPRRGSIFLSDELCKKYHLDDYRRFPTIRETLVEITPDLRIRKDIKGRPQIQTVLEGMVRDNTSFSGNMLVMIDGVPVKDIEKLLEFDAMLIGDILVYPYSYSLGNAIFGGVVDFVTKQGDISSFKFDRNVVIVDWQGESYPVAYICSEVPYGGDDFRHTLYWHPQIELEAGARKEIKVRTPSYPGTFRIVAEGLSEDGKPVRSETLLEVR